MIVLICGGRNYNNDKIVYDILDALHEKDAISELIEGGAKGADWLAGKWARHRKVQCRTFPANWNKYGPAAGPLRNQEMLDKSKPALVVAFPGGRGTKDMIGRARHAGISVLEVADIIDQVEQVEQSKENT